ncbi:MAG: antibiotic biosynthesis monooxygenase [Gammaproteobacteria bacterium]|nr:antibiotic biosynthesis monooxygenase [Gammaproteobacteria bacterium]
MNTAASKNPLAIVLICVLSAASMSKAAAEPVHYTIELRVDPARSEEFLAVMKEAAPDTRAFEGCQYFAILVDETDPGRVLFYEVWDSKEHLEAYQRWRSETNFGAKIAPYMAGDSVRTFYTKFDD